MKQKLLLLLTALCFGVVSGVKADVEESYNFASFSGSDKTLLASNQTSSYYPTGRSRLNNVDLYIFEDVTGLSLAHRFGGQLQNNDAWMLRNNSNKHGLEANLNGTRLFGILNLFTGDKVTITYSGDGITFATNNTGNAVGAALTSGTEYTITADGGLGLNIAKNTVISSISITLPDERTVGNTDNTTPGQTVWSPYYTLTNNQELYLEFTNNNSGNGKVWENWILYVQSDNDRGLGQTDYLGMNAANNSWDATGTGGHSENRITQGYDWNTFVSNMNGATVKMTVRRENDRVSVFAFMTKNDVTWTESVYFDLPSTVSEKNIRVMLSVENSHIIIDNTKTAISSTTDNYYTVGLKDKTSGWFTAMSDEYSIPANKTLKLHFKSYGTVTTIWNHWASYMTNDKNRWATGYEEYIGLRSDNWFLINNREATVSGDGVSDANKAYMDGADVYATIQNDGTKITLTTKYTTTEPETYTQTCTFTLKETNETVRIFYVCDASYLQFEDAIYVDLDETTGYDGTWTGEKAHVTVNRPISQNTWSSLVVPFDMSIPSGWTVKKVSGFEEGTVSFTDAESIVAGSPYLVKTTADVAKIESNGIVTLGPAAPDPNTAGDPLSMIGVYSSGKIDPSDATTTNFAVGSDNNLHKVTGSNVNIKAFRAYFSIAEGGSNARNTIALNLEDNYTAINALNAAEPEVNAQKDGKYLENGKIVIVKNGVKYSANGQILK